MNSTFWNIYLRYFRQFIWCHTYAIKNILRAVIIWGSPNLIYRVGNPKTFFLIFLIRKVWRWHWPVYTFFWVSIREASWRALILSLPFLVPLLERIFLFLQRIRDCSNPLCLAKVLFLLIIKRLKIIMSLTLPSFLLVIFFFSLC